MEKKKNPSVEGKDHKIFYMIFDSIYSGWSKEKENKSIYVLVWDIVSALQ